MLFRSAHLQETITGMEVVQLFGCEQRSVDRLSEANDGYLQSRLRTTFYHSIYLPFMELSGVLLLAVVLWYAGGQVLREQMEWGVLVAMLQYVPRFFMPIRDIAERFTTIQIAMASSERIFELLDTEPEPVGGSERRDEALLGEIEFRQVWFAYESQDWVLRDVSFRVAPGESLAIVGATGAGKSTIINLLLRFHDPTRGSIKIGDDDIRNIPVRQHRNRFGLVLQDVAVLSRTLRSEERRGGKECRSRWSPDH